VPLTLLVQSWRALLRHKGRSALNALGITIGIAAVVWVVAIGKAGSAQAQSQLQGLGDALVWVEAGSRNVNGLRSGTFGMHNLMLDDAAAILREVPSIKRVSPNIDGRVVVQWQTKNWTTQYRGVSPDYEDIKRWDVALGDRFTDQDDDHATNVVLLGQTVRHELFGDADPRGEVVRLGGMPFTVVGVLATKGQSSTGRDQDDEVHIPFMTVIKKVRGGGQWWLDDILCSATSARDIPAAVASITTLMRERHHIQPDQEDDFNIRHPEELIAAQIQAADTLATLLVSIAAAALLVGGIGVMNVMFASVVERTREIGVRLAFGASPGTIQAQFLIEAVLLTGFGGAAGVAVSFGGASLLAKTLPWPLPIPPQALLLAIVFSVAIGLLFGYVPARRASRLDPIAALREE
jgi:putative ABC transport system permease protein